MRGRGSSKPVCGVAYHGTDPEGERFTVSAFTIATYGFAACVGTSALIVSVWAGLLYHRVLRLPPRKREHGLRVLAHLTSMVRALRGSRKPDA